MDDVARLRLLLWKYFQFRKYYWLMTVVEIFLPMLVVYAVIKFGQKWIVTEPIGQQVTIEQPRTIEQLKSYFKYEMVGYTPADRRITEFMAEVKKIINPGYLQAFDTENSLVHFLSKNESKSVGIVILKLEKFELKYKIRDKNVWNTSELFAEAESEQNGPFTLDPYADRGFAALQLAINEVFKIKATGQNPRAQADKVQYQAFPYPEYTEISNVRAFFPLIMGVVVVVASLILCGPIMVAVIAEKETGVKELMKIGGVHEKLMWFSWFLNSMIIGIFAYTIITALLQTDFHGLESAVIRQVQTSVLWACIILFFMAQIAFCFLFCAIFNSTTIAMSSFFMTTMVLSYIAIKFHDWHNGILVHLSCFFPACALIQGFIRMNYHELLELPLTWGSLFSNETTAADASLGYVVFILFADTWLYMFLTYYISEVRPGRYGFRKSLFFLFESSKRSTKSQLVFHPDVPDAKEIEDNPFIEKVTPTTEAVIVITDLQKNFGPVLAVRGVNLNLYKDEIVAILGHNGAGKTTTLSMLTGLTEPSNGKILYKGAVNLSKNMDEYRKNVGTCPQEDRLFPYLTMIHHLVFFGMLKGADSIEAEEEAREYLQLMDLHKNAEDYTSGISKGMQRKLSLSIALMGKSEVLILDEPTAGLDAQSKEKIWNLLLELRPGRAIVFTSHNMKEADILGSRVAIMNHGIVVCYGSIQFLKKTFGTGYRLKITKKSVPVMQKAKDPTPMLIDGITRGINGAKVENKTPTELLFSLPATETAKFPAMFKNLESKKGPLNIEHISVISTTLEQVLQKVGGSTVYDAAGKPLKRDVVIEEPIIQPKPVEEKIQGHNLQLLQHQALFMKKNIYLIRNWITFLFRVVLPTLLMVLLIWGTVRFDKIDPPLEMSLKTYRDASVMLMKTPETSLMEYETFLYYLTALAMEIVHENEPNSTQALLKFARKNINAYRRDLLLAIDVARAGNNRMTALYNKWARHSLPTAINTVDTVLLHSFMKNSAYQITTINHPVKPVNVSKLEDKFDTNISEQSPILTVWFILLAFFTIDLLDYFMIPVRVERIDGFKHIQFMSSVSPFTYWVNTLVYDVALFFIIIFLRVSVFKPFDSYGFFNVDHHFAIAILMIVLFIVSGLLFIYCISFVTDSKYGSYIFFFIFNLICTFVTYTYYKFETSLLAGEATPFFEKLILTVTKYAILLVPPLNFSLAFEKFLMAWRRNHMVEAYTQQGLAEKLFETQGVRYSPYLQFASTENPTGILGEMFFLAADIALYASLLYNIENGNVTRYITKKLSKGTGKPPPPIIDKNEPSNIPEEVTAERANVQELTRVAAARTDSTNVLLVQGLKKIFVQLFRRPVNAVVDLTFFAKEGECFGILGPNGAGKTTSCRMMTGELLPTQGDAWILNVQLSKNKNEYFSKVGYCAETNCFLEELTGKETLNLIAALRGVSTTDRPNAIERWITTLGLEAVQNKQCGTYSGGFRRKICTALALIGDPKVVFLDEPTAGIDPIARRKLYSVLGIVKSSGQVITLTSHSMEECETLCDRLTILVKGDMKFIGTTEDMKTKYAYGFSLMIKLRVVPNEKEEARKEKIELLKVAITTKFRADACFLKEESQTSMFYNIKQSLSWSESFQKMEELKKSANIVEEYLLTEISLDAVFASITEESPLPS